MRFDLSKVKSSTEIFIGDVGLVYRNYKRSRNAREKTFYCFHTPKCSILPMPKTLQEIKSQSNESQNDASRKGAVKGVRVQREFED